MAECSTELEPASTTRDDVAFWLYSSGSTGQPKACVHLQHDMPVCADHMPRHPGDDGRRPLLQRGQTVLCLRAGQWPVLPFQRGRDRDSLAGAPRPADVFAVIERHRPTLLFSVPTGYGQMLAHQREPEFNLSQRALWRLRRRGAACRHVSPLQRAFRR